MDKKVTDNSKIFTLFRQSGEPSFIKFLDALKETNGKNTSNTDRSKGQSNRRPNKRQEQTIYGDEKIKTTSISLESSKESPQIQNKVLTGEV